MRSPFFLSGLIALLIPLGANAEALSPWVQGVLDKADLGIETAAGFAAGSCDGPGALQEIRNNVSVVSERRQATLDFAAQAQFLSERTVCFHSDKERLESKMQEVKDALDAAASSCNQSESRALRSVYEFLSDAYLSFLSGAADPTHTDTRLRFIWPFETDAAWTSARGPQTDTGSTAPLCPFTTDFGPHAVAYLPLDSLNTVMKDDKEGFTIKSYGCDATVLQTVVPSLQAEADGIRDFMTKTDDTATLLMNLIQQSLENISISIALIRGEPAPTALSPDPVTALDHGVQSGCLRQAFPVVQESGDPNAESKFDPAAADEILKSDPAYFDDPNALLVDPADALPTGILAFSVTDPFSGLSNPASLIRQFLERRGVQGAARPLPKEGFIGQLFDGMGQISIASMTTRQEIAFIQANIEMGTGYLDAVSRDSYERTKQAASELESAVMSLTKVTEEELPKKYIPNLVYFLIRSCVDGSCQTTLDKVAQRIFNPYCHPYVSGKYLDEDVVDKCYCADKFKNEDFCKGPDSSGEQKPSELICGEPPKEEE